MLCAPKKKKKTQKIEVGKQVKTSLLFSFICNKKNSGVPSSLSSPSPTLQAANAFRKVLELLLGEKNKEEKKKNTEAEYVFAK